MGEWRQRGEEGGAEETEMNGAEEEWTEVREAATRETELRRRQQRLYREGEQQQQQRQQSRSVLASSSSPLLEVSLDRSVMPEPVVPPVMWGTTTAAFLGVVAVTARIPRLLGAVGKSSTVTVGNTLGPVATPAAGVAGKLASAFPGLRYGARVWAGSLGSWASRRSQQWAEAFGPEAVVLPANDWSVCTLLEKVREGDGGLYRYRFGLPSSPDAVLPLELGQELTLCGLDASNQVVQGNYVPLTPRKQRGAFEVVVMKATDGAELDDGLPTTRSNREFSRFLDNLPLGDEIAVKPGRAGLVYGGANQPITDLVLVANGVGVVPMIQMVNELLPSSSSSVASASVVWLNEKAEDFALYSELEKAFFRNHRKLDVSCIVERDLFGSHLEANANVNAASPEFKIGTLAAVAGPDFFTRKVTDYLVRRGYPEDAIIGL
ncbi:Cytochrome b5 reductase domain-containing protein [Ectocarpus siliculosus]|uniref:Cytochrome b5 reductase domain-containing protein n=1 Tax=Ectocarpus siliculosus TaxID=2880 RepID=D7FMW3_ECTSI|nr:Cytochrome b5 reductase domain-containing protein [Ectocarpus siliculosus]|eukprot:CBJ30027.1 Cytochrome b5 reductase domain-containing protein [Ectocarpus siliculosus]